MCGVLERNPVLLGASKRLNHSFGQNRGGVLVMVALQKPDRDAQRGHAFSEIQRNHLIPQFFQRIEGAFRVSRNIVRRYSDVSSRGMRTERITGVLSPNTAPAVFAQVFALYGHIIHAGIPSFNRSDFLQLGKRIPVRMFCCLLVGKLIGQQFVFRTADKLPHADITVRPIPDIFEPAAHRAHYPRNVRERRLSAYGIPRLDAG